MASDANEAMWRPVGVAQHSDPNWYLKQRLWGRWPDAAWWVIFLFVFLRSAPNCRPLLTLSQHNSLTLPLPSVSLCRLADSVHYWHARSSGGGLRRGLRPVLGASGQRCHGNCHHHHHRLHCCILRWCSAEVRESEPRPRTGLQPVTWLDVGCDGFAVSCVKRGYKY